MTWLTDLIQMLISCTINVLHKKRNKIFFWPGSNLESHIVFGYCVSLISFNLAWSLCLCPLWHKHFWKVGAGPLFVDYPLLWLCLMFPVTGFRLCMLGRYRTEGMCLLLRASYREAHGVRLIRDWWCSLRSLGHGGVCQVSLLCDCFSLCH